MPLPVIPVGVLSATPLGCDIDGHFPVELALLAVLLLLGPDPGLDVGSELAAIPIYAILPLKSKAQLAFRKLGQLREALRHLETDPLEP